MIRTRGLTKIYGPSPREAFARYTSGLYRPEDAFWRAHVVAVRDVSLDVRRGELFVLMGLSGSGKSTLLRCINRLIEPTAGQVVIDDVDVTPLGKADLKRFRASKIGMVFQHFALLPQRTVQENVAFGLEVRGVARADRERRAQEMIDLVGLRGKEQAFPQELSGGQQQRVGLARALAVNPDILFLDEPFSELDPITRREMQRELRSIQRALRKTVVFVTHDLNEAVLLADRIAIMKEGTIVQEGGRDEIVLRPATEYVREFVRDVNVMNVVRVEAAMSKEFLIVRQDCFCEDALRRLEESRGARLYVADAEGRLLGRVDRSDLEVGRGTSAVLSARAVSRPVATISRSAPVKEAVPMVVHDPVAVVNEDGAMVGVIDAGRILETLGATR